ncbi:MAG: VOC family protein [Chloroflexi bacterium CFX4]|nr:VOC family protein [Chloroflexi bacterium CFX4]MDL1921887.1 VOC family protein [Chloroflexi bacterium CFX3]
MSFQLDHIVIAVSDLATAIADYHTLGFKVLEGGVHASGATHNALIIFADGTYLELLAATGAAPAPESLDFSLMLASGEGLSGFALCVPNLAEAAAGLRERGVAVSALREGARQTPNGERLAWQLALVNDGFLPFFIEDLTPRPLRVPTDPNFTAHPNGVRGIGGIEVVTPDLAASQARYSTLLGADSEPADMPDFVAFALQNAQLVISAPHRETAESVIRWSAAPLEALEDQLDAIFSAELPSDVAALLHQSGQMWQQYEAEIRRQVADRADYLAARHNAEALYAVRLWQGEAAGEFSLADQRLTHGVRFTAQAFFDAEDAD